MSAQTTAHDVDLVDVVDPPTPDDVDAWAEAPVVDEFASIDEAAAAHDDWMFGPQDADLEPVVDVDEIDAAADLAELEAQALLADETPEPLPADSDEIDLADEQLAPTGEEPQAPPAPITSLTPEQERLADELFNQHVLYKEIAERLGVPNRLISRRFITRQRPPKAKGQAPRRVLPPPTNKALPTADWPALVATIPTVATSLVAWARGTYCMVRVPDGYPASVPKGSKLHDDLPFPWATVCGHGTVKGAMKGGSAEVHGKKRDEWCPACKAGEPVTVGASPKVPAPEASTADLPVVRLDLSHADGPRVVPVEPPFAEWVLRDEVSSVRVAHWDGAAALAEAEAAAHQEQAERALAAKAAAGADATATAKKTARRSRGKATTK